MATYMIDQGVNSYRIGYATAVAVILFVHLLRLLDPLPDLRPASRRRRRDDQDGRLMATASAGQAAERRALRERAGLRRRARARSARDRPDRLRRAQRLPHDRPARVRPGRPAAPVGDAQLPNGAHLGHVLAPARQQHDRRGDRDHARRRRQLAGRVPALALASSAAARRSTPSSRSGCSSRSPSPRCRSTSCSASSGCYESLLGVALPEAAFGDPDHDHHPAPVHARDPRRARGRGRDRRLRAGSGSSCAILRPALASPR